MSHNLILECFYDKPLILVQLRTSDVDFILSQKNFKTQYNSYKNCLYENELEDPILGKMSCKSGFNEFFQKEKEILDHLNLVCDYILSHPNCKFNRT
jgi:hypothetical protein